VRLRIYIFKKKMGSTRSHPLPPGIFVEMKPSPDEFDNWTEEDFDREIKRLRERVRELKSQKVTRVDYEEVVLDPPDDDDDDIMHDPDVREMVENGEHTCHMFDTPCQACEDDDEEDEAIQKVDRLRAHFC
jgi:hypothetical protein